jgi:hypothetical protein
MLKIGWSKTGRVSPFFGQWNFSTYREKAVASPGARLAIAPGQPWALEGGYSMELRFRRAKSTKDLDSAVRFAPCDMETDPLLEPVRAPGD